MARIAINTIMAMEDLEADAIAAMIQKHEEVSLEMWKMVDAMNEPIMDDITRAVVKKCVDDVSLLLDEMTKMIAEAQKDHMKNIVKNKKTMAKWMKKFKKV